MGQAELFTTAGDLAQVQQEAPSPKTNAAREAPGAGAVGVPVTGGATFSLCGKYRYSLMRWWGEGHRLQARTINFLCLNPSTATAEFSDPTVTRLTVRAKMLGFERLVVTNIFAFRSTDPKGLLAIADPVGPDNDTAIVNFARAANLMVCAWSSDRAARDRGPAVEKMLRDAGVKLHVLKLSKDGNPMHPLYLPYELKPVEWWRND